MKRSSLFFSFLVSLLLILTGCSTSPLSIEIPDELEHSRAFVTQLHNNGIEIQAVERSLYASFNERNNNAAYIATDKGIANVIFYKNADEKLNVEKTSEGKYLVQGKPMEGTMELFISSNDTFFSVTDNKELDTEIKKIFKIKEQ